MIKYLGLMILILSVYPLVRALIGIYSEKFSNMEKFFVYYLKFIYIPFILMFAILRLFLN